MKKIIAALGFLVSLKAWGIPTTPGTLVCSSSSATAISCTWTASTDVSGIANYRVERRVRDSGAAFVEIAQRPTNDISDTVPNPVAYDYRVRSFSNGAEFSDYSTTTFVAAPKDTPHNYGVSVGSQYRTNYTSTDRATALDDIETLGAVWVRIDMTHSTVESVEGIYDWSQYDTIISEILARGLKPLVLLAYSPVWNRDVSCSTSNSAPIDRQAFANFAGAAASHFPEVTAWEIWNEPNIINFWCSPSGVSAADYTDLVKKCYIAIKAVAPQDVVLAGSMARASNSGTNSRTPISFLTDIYSNGGQHYFDAVSIHPYSFPHPPSEFWNPAPPATSSAWSQMEETTPSLRSVMTDNGDSHKKLWPTEWGAPTNGGVGSNAVTEAQQADDYVTDAYNRLALETWSGPAFFYSPRDRCIDVNNRECWFGLTYADWTHKPSFAAYVALPTIVESTLTAPTDFHRDP